MPDNGQDNPKFEEWAKLELFGRQVLAGKVSEQTIAGAGFVRIDVPSVGNLPAFTRFFYPSAIYGITPCSEDLAHKLCQHYREQPISRYELPAPAQPATTETEHSGPFESEEGEGQDYEDDSGDEDY